MPSDDLAHELSRTDRPGLDDALTAKLKIVDADITRARLRSQASDGRAHVVVHLLGAWVEDCRDIGKGEVYWWSIPMLGGTDGKIRWNALAGLPNGAQPVSVGNNSWLGGISLDKPPVLAVASPDEDVAAVMVRIGFYEDDWAPALLGPALKAGMTVLGEYKEPSKDVDGFVLPIRQAIYDSLKAKQDDFMLEKDIKLLREEGGGFGAGTISSHLTQYIRVYLFARDVERTEVAGPFKLAKGQERRVVFPSSLESGGRLAIFSRGTVKADRFGVLDVNQPFVDHAIDEKEEGTLAKGLTITAEEDAEFVAYYTPKREVLEEKKPNRQDAKVARRRDNSLATFAAWRLALLTSPEAK